jgi:hypothetical protein
LFRSLSFRKIKRRFGGIEMRFRKLLLPKFRRCHFCNLVRRCKFEALDLRKLICTQCYNDLDSSNITQILNRVNKKVGISLENEQSNITIEEKESIK